MKKNPILYVAFLSMALLLASCTNDPPIDVNAKKFTLLFWNVPLSAANYDGFLVSAQLSSLGTSGISEGYTNQAAFFDADGELIQAGSVTFNGVNIPLSGHLTSSRGLKYSDTNRQTFNVYHIWEIAPSSDVGLLKDSILAPKKFAITSPMYLSDSVSKTNFTIRYQDPGTDSVIIYFEYEPAFSSAFDKTIKETNYYSAHIVVPNTGSYNIPSTLLSGFPNKGIIDITIVGERSRSVFTTSPTRKYLHRTLAASDVLAHLKP